MPTERSTGPELPRSPVVPYQVTEITTPAPREGAFYSPAARQVLFSMLEEVVETEGPIHMGVAVRRLASAWSLKAIDSLMVHAVEEVARRGCERELWSRRGNFLWPQSGDASISVRTPQKGVPESYREIQQVPAEEIELAIKTHANYAPSWERRVLVSQVGEFLGFDTRNRTIATELNGAVNRLLKRGVLQAESGRLSLVSPD